MSRRYLNIRAVVLAIAFFGVGVMMFRDIVEAEQTGTPKSMNVVLAIAYDMAGKWGVMVMWTVFSGFFVLLSLTWTGERD